MSNNEEKMDWLGGMLFWCAAGVILLYVASIFMRFYWQWQLAVAVWLPITSVVIWLYCRREKKKELETERKKLLGDQKWKKIL